MDRARRLSTLRSSDAWWPAAPRPPRPGSSAPTAGPAGSVGAVTPSPCAGRHRPVTDARCRRERDDRLHRQVEAVPADWTRFDDPDGLFTVAFPGKPARGRADERERASRPRSTSGNPRIRPSPTRSCRAIPRWASSPRSTSPFLRTLEQNMSHLGRADIAAEEDSTTGSIPSRDSADDHPGRSLCARFLSSATSPSRSSERRRAMSRRTSPRSSARSGRARQRRRGRRP